MTKVAGRAGSQRVEARRWMPGAEDPFPALCSLPKGARGQNGETPVPHRICNSVPLVSWVCGKPERAAGGRDGMGWNGMLSPPGQPWPGRATSARGHFSPAGCSRAVRGLRASISQGAAAGEAAFPKPAPAKKCWKGTQRWCGHAERGSVCAHVLSHRLGKS